MQLEPLISRIKEIGLSYSKTPTQVGSYAFAPISLLWFFYPQQRSTRTTFRNKVNPQLTSRSFCHKNPNIFRMCSPQVIFCGSIHCDDRPLRSTSETESSAHRGQPRRTVDFNYERLMIPHQTCSRQHPSPSAGGPELAAVPRERRADPGRQDRRAGSRVRRRPRMAAVGRRGRGAPIDRVKNKAGRRVPRGKTVASSVLSHTRTLQIHTVLHHVRAGCGQRREQSPHYLPNMEILLFFSVLGLNLGCRGS